MFKEDLEGEISKVKQRIYRDIEEKNKLLERKKALDERIDKNLKNLRVLYKSRMAS